MDTIIKEVNKNNIDQAVMNEASAILKEGGTVAFPTETVYGLGANALDKQAIGHIFKAKGRPSDNPLIVHIGDIKQMDEVALEITPIAKKLIDCFWPGPLTVILKKAKKISTHVTAGLDTVGIRMPNHPIALQLLKTSSVPVAAPSANTSGKPSPTIASHVIEDLKGRVDMIIDGGNANIGVESTVIDATGPQGVILRPGAITLEMCQEVLGENGVTIDPAILENAPKHLTPKSPGMKYTHYSPKAEVYIVNGEKEQIIDKIQRFINQYEGKVGIMATEELLENSKLPYTISLGSQEEPEKIAATLFKTLRDFDEMGVDVVLAEAIEDTHIGMAIMNRLTKAAGYKYL
ncbi:L-threonylcarbamoyladenylate synthase [Vallitalea okinawensis]|uniref:L-threonylcarbamoyladenylate synthase n=1 Tax=Vallitalea okinawensis TaxID=2078660 RepID=UPI000CFE2A71|nr:L-threonylcarbamoyladenylate synthase [Vallitalea okinawensis]